MCVFLYQVMKTGLVVNANGSSFFESGDIQLQCTVHGPRPIRGSFIDKASFNVEVKLAPFDTDPSNPEIAQQQGTQGNSTRPNGTSVLEKGMASFIQTSLVPAIRLETYPKSTIDLFVTIINRGRNTKSLYSAGVNAASVALINADISLRDIVTSGSALIQTPFSDSTVKPQVFVDPESPPLLGDIGVVVSYMTARNEEIVGMVIDGGVLSEKQLSCCLSNTLEVSKTVRTLVNRLLITEFRSKEQALLGAVKVEKANFMEVGS